MIVTNYTEQYTAKEQLIIMLISWNLTEHFNCNFFQSNQEKFASNFAFCFILLLSNLQSRKISDMAVTIEELKFEIENAAYKQTQADISTRSVDFE